MVIFNFVIFFSVGYTHFDVSHLHDTGVDDSYPANL